MNPRSGSKKLSELKPGQSAVIIAIHHPHWSSRLWEMGLVPGEVITLSFFAPMGDPLAFSINGNLISLRKDLAALVEVRCEA